MGLAAKDPCLCVAESRKTFRETWVGAARSKKVRPPAAAPGTSDLAAESHLLAHPPTIRGDDPEAFGSAAQPTPPGPYVANLWRAPCSVRPGVWRIYKVKLTIEPVFKGVK